MSTSKPSREHCLPEEPQHERRIHRLVIVRMSTLRRLLVHTEYYWMILLMAIILATGCLMADESCRIPRFISCMKGDNYIGRVCVRQCLKKGICAPCSYITHEYEGPTAISYYTELCKKYYPQTEKFISPVSICYAPVD